MRGPSPHGNSVIARLFLCLLLLQLAVSVGRAASLPEIGTRLSGSVELFDRTVPLPPGPWQVASAGFGRTDGHDPGPYGAIGGVLLVRPDEGAGEFLLIHTNALPVRDGWGQPSECADDEALLQQVSEARDRHN